ncbi:fused MFS/spermidine synthase [Cellulomonas sp. zg-ZUI199]|uniref:Fused MFS/spermidine synthase n=1 Tax=Cellulomonas wangleii TaxID=2816956 RepID=A0ABX8D8K6_9CELL|nr:fused MFS/spermidine synthase [Cellulomonas wangleii]MBO0925714.1 fused MFS/spermidine synthase [Cellulomonas wangleii]QVI63758.1 fused MFS/spermidine synthase [Cellulomonas wangleii]
MAARRRDPSSRRPPTSRSAPTAPAWPVGPVPVATGTVEVVPEPGRPRAATLLVNGVPSSFVDLDDPGLLDFEYMQQAAAVVEVVAERRPDLTVLHLGAGGCALARALAHRHPEARQLAVELDGDVARLAREWFALPRAPRLRLRTGEARAELTGLADATYDVVARDVFAGDRTPDHLTTVEFAREVRRVLRPGGVYVANCADRPPLALARAELATLAAVFPHVGVVAEPAQLRGRRYGNLLLVATDDPDLLDDAGLARTLRTLPVPARLVTGAEVRTLTGAAAPRHDPQPTVEPPTPDEPEPAGDPAG